MQYPKCSTERDRRTKLRSRTLRFYPLLETLEIRCLPTVTINGGFSGLDFNAGSTEPPDTDVAVGSNFVVETVNTTIAICNKATQANVFQKDLSQFFAPAGGGPVADMYDPSVTYDDLSNRFVVSVMEENDTAKTAFLDVAFSNTSDPTQGFTEMHRVSVKESSGTKSFWADFPRFGFNADSYVFSLNMYQFPSATGAFDHVQVVSFAKSSVLDGNNSTVNVFRADRNNPADFTLVPTEMHSSASGDPMWFLEENDGSTNLRFVKASNLLSSSPTFIDSVVAVPSYSPVVPPIQPNGKRITTVIDSGILNAAMRGTELVASQNVGQGNVTRAQWYQFDMSSGSPTLSQSGAINQGAGVYTYFPAIDVSAAGNLGMSFMESSSSEFMSMYVTGRLPSDPAGTMEQPVLVKAGQANYNGTRAGDFSGIGVDPANGSFWAGNEFANKEATNWGTWIANFEPNTVPITITSLSATPNPGIEGSAINLSGAFTDPTVGQAHTIFINWGDNSKNDSFMLAPGVGSFGPVSHAYTEESAGGSPYNISVTVNNSTGGTGSSNTAITINDAKITPTGIGVSASQNEPFSGPVASFVDDDTNGTVSDYTTTITWGDGQSSSGTIAANGSGGFTISGTHTYTALGSGSVSVLIADAGGSNATASTMAIVRRPVDFVTAADAGGGPDVEVYDGYTGARRFGFFAYDPRFNGGVRLAVGDVNGDGVPDIITAPGPGGGPDVRVFDGVTGVLIKEFMAYDPHFLGGLFVAAADLNGDGKMDIITAPDAGGGPDVRVFDGATGALIREFYAYDSHFLGGVRIAAGDINADHKPEIIAAPGPGGGPDVRVFDGISSAIIREFYAYAPGFDGGVYVAAGDVNNDGKADIITGAGAGGGPHVQVFSGTDNAILYSFYAYAPGFTGGVRVSFLSDVNGDSQAEIIASPGPSGGPEVEIFDSPTLSFIDNFYAYDSHFLGGVFIGGN